MSSSWRSVRLLPPEHESPDFEEGLEVDKRETQPDAV
jgi:hypothetical protein